MLLASWSSKENRWDDSALESEAEPTSKWRLHSSIIESSYGTNLLFSMSSQRNRIKFSLFASNFQSLMSKTSKEIDAVQ